MRNTYPEMSKAATILTVPIEDGTRDFVAQGKKFDLVFSMAVLEHITVEGEAEGAFSRIAELSRRLICTIEVEFCVSQRHFARNYRRVFEAFGFKQIQVYRSIFRGRIGGAMPRTVNARLFKRLGRDV